MALLDERLPDDPVEAEAVLHVHAHLRRQLRARRGDLHGALRLLFGIGDDEIALVDAVTADDPVAAAADVLARRDGSSVVSFGHGSEHVERCRLWLLARKLEDEVFADTIAFDLHTLLTLSQARDAANLRDRLMPDAAESPVLLTGETGTGKELLARGLHALWATGRQNAGDLEALFISGMPPELANDELFGHVKGAFTDAKDARPGRLEEAHGRCLLVDEIGDLSHQAQVRLLRFLDRGEVTRTGANKTERVRVRILAATLKDLDVAVEAGGFRRDLLHRLGTVRLHLPPLRERAHFDEVVLAMLDRARHLPKPPIARLAMGALRAYPWPGNLRELRHVMNAAIQSAEGGTIELDDLPSQIRISYLALPVEARAADIICNETERQPLTVELVSHRISSVMASLDGCPAPTPEGGLAEVAKFLEGIPDSSSDHLNVLERAHQAVARQTEVARLRVLGEKWAAMGHDDLHPLARAPVGDQAAAIEALRRAAETTANAAVAQVHLDEDPWWLLHGYVRSLPLLHGAEPADVYNALQLAFRVVLTLPPEIKQAVLDSVRAKEGWRGIWGVFSPLLEGQAREPLPAETMKPGQQPREFWLEVAELPSLAEAVACTGYSDKSIRDYLAKYEVVAGWSRKNGGNAPDA